jgi:predicted outer membrane protein
MRNSVEKKGIIPVLVFAYVSLAQAQPRSDATRDLPPVQSKSGKALENTAESSINVPQSPTTRRDYVSMLHEVYDATAKFGALAVKRAKLQATRQFGETLMNEQSRLGTRLTSITDAKKTRTESGFGEQKAKQLANQYLRLEKIEASAFDRQFAEAMVQQLDEQIHLLRMAKQIETDTDLLSYYNESLKVVQAHLRQAHGLLRPQSD